MYNIFQTMLKMLGYENLEKKLCGQSPLLSPQKKSPRRSLGPSPGTAQQMQELGLDDLELVTQHILTEHHFRGGGGGTQQAKAAGGGGGASGDSRRRKRGEEESGCVGGGARKLDESNDDESESSTMSGELIPQQKYN